jgi:hypothetical protein
MRGSVRRLLTLGQPHRNTAIRAPLQSRRSFALLVTLVLCLSALVLATNEAWAKEQPSPAAQQGPAEGKNTPNGQANGKVGEPVRGTPTPPVTPPAVTPPAVTPPAFQEPPAVTPPVQKPPVENAPPPPASETLPPAEKPSSPPLDPAPSTPKPDPVPQATPQPAPQAGGEEDVESDPVPNTSQPPMTGSDRVVEPEPVSAALPDIVDEVEDIVYHLAPAPASAPTTPAAADEGHAAGPAPDPVLPLPALAAASDQVLPAASEGLAELVRGLVTAPATAPATTPIAPWGAPLGDGSPLTTITNNKPAAAFVAAAVPSAPAVGEALRLSSSLGTRAAGALGSTVGTVQNAAASAAASVATSVASATAEVFRTLAGGSAGTPSTDATNGTQQAPSDGIPQEPVAPPAPPLGGVFSPFTGAAGQLGAGGGVAPLLVGILALLTVILTRRDFRTYLIACEMPKPSSALLRPLERPG